VLEEDAERVELGPLHAVNDRRVVLHHPSRGGLVIGLDDHDREWAVVAWPAKRTTHARAAPEVRAVALEKIALLRRRRIEEATVERRPED
jgi:hypothetical protein